MTQPPLSQQCRRIIALQQDLCAAIDESECQWGEAVGCVGFALGMLLDRHEDDAVRVAMAQRVAEHLMSGAWTRGSFGEPERMQ
jgi:hypothetical protein